MKFPKQNELIKVFDDHHPGKDVYRYFKEEVHHYKSRVCVYANGQTKEMNDGEVEYWDRWEYPKLYSKQNMIPSPLTPIHDDIYFNGLKWLNSL